MRLLAWLVVCFWLASAPAFADDMTLLGVGGRSGAAATYTGLGDIVSGWTFYVSCGRAYNAAYATSGTNPACDVTRADSQVCTIKIATTGLVDLVGKPCTGTGPTGTTGATTIAQFLTSTTGTVSKGYDQTGNGNTFTANTSGQQPAFSLAFANGLPCMGYTHASNTALFSGSVATSAPPLALVAEAERTTTTSFVRMLSTFNGSNEPLMDWENTSGGVRINAGTTQAISGVSEPALHSFLGFFNGASSFITVDGTDNSVGSPGTNSTSNVVGIGNDGAGDNTAPDGTICEAAMFLGSLTAPQRASIGANMVATW